MDDVPLGGGDAKVDPELQEFLMLEKQKAQVNAQVIIDAISKNCQAIATFFLFIFRFTNLTKSAGTNVWISQARSSTARQKLASPIVSTASSIHRF